MTFLEALPLLVNGQRFRKPDWEPGVWIQHDKFFGEDELVFTDQDKDVWEPRISDVLATDWEEQLHPEDSQ